MRKKTLGQMEVSVCTSKESLERMSFAAMKLVPVHSLAGSSKSVVI